MADAHEDEAGGGQPPGRGGGGEGALSPEAAHADARAKSRNRISV